MAKSKLTTAQRRELLQGRVLDKGIRWEGVGGHIDFIVLQASLRGDDVSLTREIVPMPKIDREGSIWRNTRFDRKFDTDCVTELELAVKSSKWLAPPVGYWMPASHPLNKTGHRAVDILSGNHRLGVCASLQLPRADLVIVTTRSQPLLERLRNTFNNLEGRGQPYEVRLECALADIRATGVDVTDAGCIRDIATGHSVHYKTLSGLAQGELVRHAAQHETEPDIQLKNYQLRALYALRANEKVMGKAARVIDEHCRENAKKHQMTVDEIRAIVSRINARKAGQEAKFAEIARIRAQLKEHTKTRRAAEAADAGTTKTTPRTPVKPERDRVLKHMRALKNYLNRRAPGRLADMAITTAADREAWFLEVREIRAWFTKLEKAYKQLQKHDAR